MDRIDLSSWILHFVHDRNPENNAALNINEGDESLAFPYHVDRDVNARFEHWEQIDEAAGLAEDDHAIVVLLKIIEDGHIRAGWSWRNAKPTIYGPRAACCFTEMPLYGLIEYAKMRAKNAVSTYAIGLLRDEFFFAGGRPAIYGLSTTHSEVPVPRRKIPFLDRWPRYLSPSCGIGKAEQYRYVSTNLTGGKRIDWTFEREWRWADVQDKYSCPGLPIWLSEQDAFSKVMIIVPKDADTEMVLERLKELRDAGEHNFGHKYDASLLEKTFVISLEQLTNSLTKDDLKTIRLEDIPSKHLEVFSTPVASKALVKSVRQALAEAHIIAEKAATDYLKAVKKSEDGFIDGGCGFSDVVIYDAQSDVVSALQQLGEVSIIGGVGYKVSSFGRHGARSQNLSVIEAATKAAADYLNAKFTHVQFSIRSRLD
ncbi:hypothetical protein [Burkholderia contaminans]|uniref:Uncharacterized protein n=1 Tax=Burkholderia contaminans TaxID=488447 RepID=A0AAP4VMK0_9BURK|nr:hypothetical protein [Burkholderia contaminans]MDN7569969.1 hypothetical protein [Burkholderia contaminans]